MAGKDYFRGILLALLWVLLLFAMLYVAACFAPAHVNMRGFILLLAFSWPPLAGLSAGWRDGRQAGGNGFAAALRWVAVPLLLIAALWWWLLPQLWQVGAYGKFALYVLIAALFSGGLGAGLAKARLMLYPPPPPEDEEA